MLNEVRWQGGEGTAGQVLWVLQALMGKPLSALTRAMDTIQPLFYRQDDKELRPHTKQAGGSCRWFRKEVTRGWTMFAVMGRVKVFT